MFLIRETRTVTKYGRVKLCCNEYAVKSVPHGVVVEVRYDPFDLSKVYLFEDKDLKETLQPAKLNAMVAKDIPEEADKPVNQVSAESQCYFQNLRQQQIDEQKNQAIPAYSQLMEGKK